MRPGLQSSLLLSLTLLAASGLSLHSQTRYYDNWFFGDSAGIHFSSGQPQLLNGSIRTEEGSDAISDPNTGELLFYTDGISVWNHTHAIMQGGRGLKGGTSSTQSALIVPMPGNPSGYYIFTADEGEYRNPPNEGIHYSIVDMEGDGGLGEVTTRNIPLLPHASEKLVGIRHCNGRDFWVIAYREGVAEYHAWMITSGGVSDPVVTSLPHTSGTSNSSIGFLKASPDGRYLFSIEVGTPGVGRLLEFDNRTGEVVRSVGYFPAGYGASFSRESTYLYTWIWKWVEGTRVSEIVRYPVRSADSATIAAGTTSVGELSDSPGWVGAFQLAPDGQIYISIVSALLRIGVIENPDAVDARFRDSAILSDRHSYSFGLANSIDGYFSRGTSFRVQERIIDTTACVGQPLRLLPSEGSRYLWDSLPDNGCLDCRDPLVLPEEGVTYGVTIWTEGTCAFREIFRVSLSEPPEISITGDTVVCAGSSLPLRASGGTRYLWEGGPELSCTDCPDPDVTPDRTTTYYVTVWNESGCHTRDSVRVRISSPPTADAGRDTMMCLGQSVRLAGRGGTTFLWRRTDGRPAMELSCSDCPDPLASPRETSTYILEITDSLGCRDVDSVTVQVMTTQEIEITGDTITCPATPTQISATGAEIFRWDFSPDLSCLDCPDPIATPSATTTYYVTGTTRDGGCPGRDSIVIRVSDLPMTEAGSDTSVCSGSSLQLHAGGGVRYLWDAAPDLSCLDCSDPVVSPRTTTTYVVTGYSSEGCLRRDSVTVRVLSPPDVDAGSDQAICAGDTVRLGITGGESWLWEPSGDLSCTDCADPVASPEVTTTYHVTAWNREGCSVRDSVTVVVREPIERLIRIGRTYIGSLGEPMVVTLLLEDEIEESDVTEMALELTYDPKVMTLDHESIARLLEGTLMEKWVVEVTEHRRGVLRLRLRALTGITLTGIGEFLRFEVRMFLADVRGTELPFSVHTTGRCVSFLTEPGYAAVDTICGFDLRLIEIGSLKYQVPTVYPNPASSGRVTVEFGLGLEGRTRLEMFDQLGHRVALLIDQILVPGAYRVEWDIRNVAAGSYRYRLSSAGWEQTGQIIIE